jgi:CRISPR-associated protein Cas1
MNHHKKKIWLNGNGAFLGRGEGCLIVRSKEGEVKKYHLFDDEVGEVEIKNGNLVSSAALQTCGFWSIPVVITTQRGNPVAYLRSLQDDSHVKTRICQYKATENEKGIKIAKAIVLGKILGQNELLKKYGLRQHDLPMAKKTIESIPPDNLTIARRKLLAIEGRFSDKYFQQVFDMMPQSYLLTKKRRTFKAYDGLNNTFNLAYTVLKWRVHAAIIKAKLEPFLGFLHVEQFGTPSLACDLMELYRFLIDDFIIRYCKNLRKRDFQFFEDISDNGKRKGKRQYLTKDMAKNMIANLNAYFGTMVQVPRIRNGSKQMIETLFGEESLLLAKYLRGEKEDWVPRISALGNYRLVRFQQDS